MPVNVNYSQCPPANLKALLARAGIMPTRQRLEIACVLLERPQHLSAEQVLRLVNRTGHLVSKATVYNTLGLFARKGIVREVLVDPNRVLYDSNTKHHYHFYNEDTGTLTDVGADCLQVDTVPALPEGTRLAGVDVVIRLRNS